MTEKHGAFVIGLSALWLACGVADADLAQASAAWPAKPVKIIVPYARHRGPHSGDQLKTTFGHSL
jgi:hypothetical protein